MRSPSSPSLDGNTISSLATARAAALRCFTSCSQLCTWARCTVGGSDSVVAADSSLSSSPLSSPRPRVTWDA